MSSLGERDFKRFEINEITNINFEVPILGFITFLNKKFEENINLEHICINNKYVKRCYSVIQLIKNFFEFCPNWTVYFILLKGRGKYFQRFLIRLIVKLNLRIIHHRTGVLSFYNYYSINKSKISIVFRKIKYLLGKIIHFPA